MSFPQCSLQCPGKLLAPSILTNLGERKRMKSSRGQTGTKPDNRRFSCHVLPNSPETPTAQLLRHHHDELGRIVVGKRWSLDVCPVVAR
jgi:hypothetical protein